MNLGTELLWGGREVFRENSASAFSNWNAGEAVMETGNSVRKASWMREEVEFQAKREKPFWKKKDILVDNFKDSFNNF